VFLRLYFKVFLSNFFKDRFWKKSSSFIKISHHPALQIHTFVFSFLHFLFQELYSIRGIDGYYFWKKIKNLFWKLKCFCSKFILNITYIYISGGIFFQLFSKTKITYQDKVFFFLIFDAVVFHLQKNIRHTHSFPSSSTC
jgi:hypothetical protein